jgi:hypothetical protein
VAPPAGVLVREASVRGVGTQGAELHECGAGAGDVGRRSVRATRPAGRSRAGRRATRGVLRNRNGRSGRRLTAMPLLLLRSAARTAGGERETPRHASVVHERASSPSGEGPCRDGLRLEARQRFPASKQGEQLAHAADSPQTKWLRRRRPRVTGGRLRSFCRGKVGFSRAKTRAFALVQWSRAWQVHYPSFA